MFINYSLFFALVVPGFIATLVFELVCRCRIREGYRFIVASLIFDLFILIINLTFLYVVKDIFTVTELMVYFNCISFTIKYIIMSVLVAIGLGILWGLLCFLPCFRRILCRGNRRATNL